MKTRIPQHTSGSRKTSDPAPKSTATNDPKHNAISAVREGSVLDRLVQRGSLADAWAAATAEDEGEHVRERGRLEQQLGASLGDVRVHSGARARSLLDRLGALGAARGQQVLIADPHDRETLTHELAHTVQARGAGEGGGLVRADHAAEHEAEHAADYSAHTARAGRRLRRKLRLRERIGAKAIALRRRHDPSRGARPPLREDDLLDPVPVVPAPERTPGDDTAERAPATPTERQGAAPPEAQPTETAEPEVEAGTEAEAERAAEGGEADTAVREGAAEGELEPSPNRREDVDGMVEQQQEHWDEGADTADGHEAEACPRHAVGDGERPFARGPPLDVPATQPLPDLDNPQAEAPDRAALDRAESSLQTAVDRAPSASSFDSSSINAETDAERRREAQRVRGRVDSLLGQQSVDRPDNPQVSLEGEADIEARRATADAAITTATDREGAAARTATEEDFGEDRMAPVVDPTEGHDTTLDNLQVPQVDLEAEIEAATRDRIATAGNAGLLSLDQAVVVRQEEMSRINALADERSQRGDAIDQGIAQSERAFTRLCQQGAAQREQIRSRTDGQVSERRQAWRRAADDHVTTRQGEASAIVREKTAHARTLAADADRDAAAELDNANTRATEQARDIENRAHAKSQQSESSSWWEETIDWVREKIDQLVDWIDDFIDAAHRAIDFMLDVASDVAHSIVENGRRAVQATLDLAHDGVDAIAENLPGELGDLAREHRDDMHAFLDEQQAAVDAYADGLHEDIDTAIEDVRQDLHEGLEDFRDGVHDVRDAANEVLDVAENGIMALLQRYFPEVAAFVEGGILGPIDRAGAQLQEWAQTALDATGLGDLEATLQELHATRFCQPQTEQEQAIDCAQFQARLESIKGSFEELLASPVAQSIQGMLQSSQDEQESQQVDAITGFFSFIRWVAEPVYEWWQSVEPQVNAAIEWLGDMAQAAWEHIARALGLDISLPPLEAIRQALERAWQAIADAAAPLIDRLREAWRWVVEDSPLASIISFFASIPEAISALGQLIGQMTDAAGAWLAEAAETLANTIMPVVNRALGAVADVLGALVDRIVGWADQLLAAFDAILAWEAAHALLQAVLGVVQGWASVIRVAIQLFRDCGERALRALADVIRNLVDYARTILDIASGLVYLILGFPASLIPWFAGNVWLYLVPDCYKAPILNFLLDLAIQTVQFIPEPADFMWAAVYQGLLNFLQGLREAPDAQKVGAMNLMASLFAGNAEALAGFAVGLVEGVWDATVGTIIFLVQAVAWLISLPFKLIRWAAGLVMGNGGEEQPGQRRGDDTRERSDDEQADDAAEEAVGGSLGRQLVSDERQGQPNQRGPPDPELLRQAQAAEQRANSEPEPSVPAEPLPEDDFQHDEPESLDTAALDRAGQDATATGPEGEGGGGQVAGPEGDVDPDRPPAIPEAIAGLGGTLQQLLASGFTRQDVQAALDGVRQTMRQFIGRVARSAAQQMLASLNADGAAFAIGRTVGNIVGQLLVEAILAFFTGGASAGLAAARAALTGARAAGRLAGVLRRIRSAVQPLLQAMSRLRTAVGRVVGQLRRWLDDVLAWMRGVGQRVQRRVQRFTQRGPGRAPGRSPGRGGRGGRGPGHRQQPGRDGRRNQSDRDRRDGDRDRETPAEKRRRLERAQRALSPRIRRFLDRGKRPQLLRAQLAMWRVRYRLSRLRAIRRGRQLQIDARINPRVTFDGGVSYEEDDLLRMFTRVARRFMRDRVPHASSRESRQALARMREDALALGPARASGPGAASTFRPSRPMDDLILARHQRNLRRFPDGSDTRHGRARPGRQIATHQEPGGGRFTRAIDPETSAPAGGYSYPDLVARLSHHSPEEIGRALRAMQTGSPVAGSFAGDERLLGELRSLLFGTEIQRNQRNLIFSAMTHGLMVAGQVDSLDEAIAMHPATQQDAMSGFRQVSREVRGREPMTGFEHRALARSAATQGITTEEAGALARGESRDRQLRVLRRWFSAFVAGRTDAGNIQDLEEYIMDWLSQYYGAATRASQRTERD